MKKSATVFCVLLFVLYGISYAQETITTEIETSAEEYLIQSGDNGKAGINWHFYKNYTFDLSIYILEIDSTLKFHGKWKLENNVISAIFDFDNIEADSQNIKALFTSANPKLKSMNKDQAVVEIDISPDLNWIWIYGIRCNVKTLP